MNCKIAIIVTSLLVYTLAGSAWAGLSETAAPEAGTAGQALSTSGDSGGEAGINFLLDRFAGVGSSDPATGYSGNRSIPIIPPISETSLFSSFTRADAPMNAYYSRSGSDNKESVAAISRSSIFSTAVGGNLFVLPEAGLVAVVQGYFVGSGAVVGDAGIAPIQASSSSPNLVQTSDFVPATVPSPLPVPFILTASGLLTLLGLRKRFGIIG